jgi:rod shape-determining protein MreC
MRKRIPIIVLALLLLIIPVAASEWVRNLARTAVAPIGRVVGPWYQSTVERFTSWQQLANLRSDRATLQGQVVRLQQQVSQLEQVKRENETLRKEAGVQGVSKEIPKLAARIILHDSDPLEHSMVIDVGSDQGVKTGQPVVSEGVLVGRVTSAAASTATIRLIISKHSVVQAWVSTSREKGLLIGDGNAVFIDKLQRSAKVEPNQLVETSGLGDTLPVGLTIGQINQAASNPSDSVQRFRITPLVDLTSLESVFILLTDPAGD